MDQNATSTTSPVSLSGWGWKPTYTTFLCCSNPCPRPSLRQCLKLVKTVRISLRIYARRPPFHLTCSGNVRADGGGSGEHHTRGGPGRALPKPVVRPRVAANGKGEREEADRHLSLIPACVDRGHRISEEDYERTGAVTPPSAFCFWAKENLSYGCSCGVPLVGEERKSVECVRVVPLATHIQTTHPKTHRATYSFQECG